MAYDHQRGDQALPHRSGQTVSASRRQARRFLASTGRALRSPYCLPLCLILLAGSTTFVIPHLWQLHKDGAFRRAPSTESLEIGQIFQADVKEGEVEPFELHEIDLKQCKLMEQYSLRNRLNDLDKTLDAIKEEKRKAMAAGNEALIEMMRSHSQANLEAITTSERTRIRRTLRTCFLMFGEEGYK